MLQPNQERKQLPTEDLYTNWMRYKPGRKTRVRNYEGTKRNVIPTIENTYNVLRTLIEPQVDVPPISYKKLTTRKKNSVNNSKRQKIIIIGDSHAKGCAADIKHVLGETVEVTGYVNPGSKIENITDIANTEIDVLTKKDIVVVWGGADDIARNESEKGLTYLSKFVEHRKNTNIILVRAPERHGLLNTSCVNSEVDTFNRKLHKKMKLHEHLKVIDSVIQRGCYTRHGLHLNRLGKQQMAHRIVNQIKNSIVANNTLPIPLSWQEVPMVYNLDSTDTQGSLTVSRTSGRKRKQPTTREDDFLWIGDRLSKA